MNPTPTPFQPSASAANPASAPFDRIAELERELAVAKAHHQRDEALLVQRTDEIRHLEVERERIRGESLAVLGNCAVLEYERDALRAEVERLKAELSEKNEKHKDMGRMIVELRARVAELEQAQSQILTDKDYVGGVCYWVTKHDALMLRVMELEDKAANQAGRIRYLEGATNHATGTPLSHAKKRIEELERDRDRLDWLLLNSYCFNGREQIVPNESLDPVSLVFVRGKTATHDRAAIDAAREKGQP